MISKSKTKLIRSLERKKARQQERCFVAEGPKVVGDLLAVMPARMVVHTSAWPVPDGMGGKTETILVDDEELRHVSFLQHPQDVLAVFPLPSRGDGACVPPDKLSLALDGVRDPGNLGTIVRIADWFGIEDIFCSRDTVDAYNPKVVQATMGSIARVRMHEVDLPAMLSSLSPDFPVYATMLEGTDIYTQPLSSYGLIVMGNEGKGVSPAVRQGVNRRLLIPSFPRGRNTAESLNVAVATAVTCAEFRRRDEARQRGQAAG